ncbi:Mut7-C ubiquitin/RNAse domain-containing protein [Pontibacter sp. E15-1]|uniref:Mut7-C ubiquitin/RNAse domain-containing protein n=1 Tax=Pontibacter sp. E15-1 TaxID=2919918 RepID=UPI001F4FC75F|nr:Mut7-C ubiquitin/RNAse domain-containing protein [Pontibacter sp. E15-1]MCJ8165064.1 Mut7-C ubiquitin/RNAse domain-containing protein [Pontibacter sp. E15-1]
MKKSATVVFYGSLNDFLPASKRGQPLRYAFAGSPAVKDALEAIRVPHPEVDVLLVNRKAVGLYYALQASDDVAVYPAKWCSLFPDSRSVRYGLEVPDRFVLDVHLGRLARSLRMLGFDSAYRTDYTDQEIACIAVSENRIALTRDIGLLKQKAIQWGYWLRSQHLEAQLQEVLDYFDLKPKALPFTRCLVCNGPIGEVAKEQVLAQLPPKTRQYFTVFYQCQSCSRVYWKGSHYDRMQAFLQRSLSC